MSGDRNPFDDDENGVESDQTCWRDSTRMCGEDCVAYDDKCEEDPRWLPCTLLNLKRARAKSFSNIAMEMKRYNDHRDSAYQELESSIRYLSDKADKAKKTGTFASKEEAEKYAKQIKEMDPGPPEIKT